MPTPFTSAQRIVRWQPLSRSSMAWTNFGDARARTRRWLAQWISGPAGSIVFRQIP
jgi:hypothetical protein